MLKIAGWRNSSIKFSFDKSEYSKLITHHERSNYATAVIEKFGSANSGIPNLLKASISQQVQNNIEYFTTILGEYINTIVKNSNFLSYVKFIAVASTFMKKIPRAERYSNFADLICHFCFEKENKSDQPYFVATLHFLFTHQEFCNAFIGSAQMQTLIISFLKGPSTELPPFCDAISTPELIISLMNNEDPQKDQPRTQTCAENCIPQLFEFTISQRAQIYSVYTLIQFLARLAYKICQKYKFDILKLQQQPDKKDKEWFINELKSQNQTLIDKISQNEVFGNLNVCLKMKENPTVIIQTYSYLLRCTSFTDNALNGRSSVINVRALQRFIQLYKETSVQTKKSILSFLLNYDDLYKHPFCCNCCSPNQRDHFPYDKFCVESVLENTELFDIYAHIIEKVVRLKHPEVVERSFQKIMLLIKPTSNTTNYTLKFQLHSIFQWFSQILLMEGISPRFFRDQSFFVDFIINPPNDVVLSYLKMPGFYQVLSILIDEKRNLHRKHALFRKMIDLAIYQPDIQNSLLSLLSENFGPDVFRFYLKNMDQPKIHDVFDPFLPFNSYDFRNLFKLGNCFEIVLRKINSRVFLIDLLKLICLIVNQTNDHFFDEWVIMQPKNSPLFELESKVIRDYVIPPHNDSSIYIPSLLPLIENYYYEGESSFNMYLIGRFATPVFNKLNLKNPYFPSLYLYYVTSLQQIKQLSMSKQEQSQLVHLMKDVKNNFIIPCYEFFPHSSLGYLEIMDVPVSSICFNIKFNKVSSDSVCFMRFSGLCLIYKNGKIFIGNDSPFKINTDQWIKVTVKSKLFSRTEISVNGTVFTVSKSFQFECLGDNNGLAFVSYIIDKNIIVNEMENSGAVVKLKGSAAFVPIHSIKNYLDNYQHFLDVIEIFADNDETRNIPFLISLSQYINPSSLESFYSDVFQAILRNSNKIVSTTENNKNNDWITTLVDFVNQIDDLKIRTQIFCSFLFDIETWTKLTIHQMKTFIAYFIFQLDNHKLQNELIFTKYNFLFSLIISNYFDNNDKLLLEEEKEALNKNYLLGALFFSLWNIVLSSIPNDLDKINEIVPFTSTVKISSLDFSLEIQEFDVGKVLDNLSLVSSERTEIICMIYELEKSYNRPFFNLEYLMQLALTQDEEVAEKAFDRIRERCKFSSNSDVLFISKNIPVLSKIGQRFAKNESTWIFFTEFLIKQTIEKFPIQVDSILSPHFEHPEFLYILTSLLISLSQNVIVMDDNKEKVRLIEMRKNCFDFVNSIFSSSKIDDSFIFSDQSLLYIYDLMIGGELFNIANWMIMNEDDLKSFFPDSKLATPFSQKMYQSIPLIVPLFIKIYDSVLLNKKVDSKGYNLPDEYCELTSSLFQSLIMKSFHNEKYFFYVLQILFNVKNIFFIHENLMYIMLFLMTPDINDEMLISLKNFFYILSIIRPEVFTNDFINQIFSKCINERYFNVLSTYISCNDNFSFKIPDNDAEGENKNENESEFHPFLKLLELFGSQFIQNDLCCSSFVAVKLIQKGCNDQLFNDFLKKFETNNVILETDSNSTDIDSIEKVEKEVKITPDVLQKFVGPTFAHLICTLHDYSKITADKPLLENAINEFNVIYKVIKTQRINNEIFKEFKINYKEASLPSEEQVKQENENDEKVASSSVASNPVLSHLATASLDKSNSANENVGVISREDQKQFAFFAMKMISQSLFNCYNANKFFFNEFNLRLRRKEFDLSLKYFKATMFNSHVLKSAVIDQNRYDHINNRHKYEHEVITVRNGRSYKISPFNSPYRISTAVFPSNFSLRAPNTEKDLCQNDKSQEKTFIFFKPTVNYSISTTKEIPSYLFKFSSLYNFPQNLLLTHFESLFGEVESMMNCVLIRLDLRINSIIMKLNSKMYVILTDASYEPPNGSNGKGEIKLAKEISFDLCTDVLNGDYGRFLLFCGHFVLLVSVDDILLSTSYVSLTNPNSVYVNSISCGTFIIEFMPHTTAQSGGIISNVINAVTGSNLDFPSPFSSSWSSHEGKKYLLSINESKTLWLSSEMSNMEYLLRLNRAAQRSFDDLSSYPIMPRVLKKFTQDEFPFIFEKPKTNQPEKVEKSNVSSLSMSNLNTEQTSNDNEAPLTKAASQPSMTNMKKNEKDENGRNNSSSSLSVLNELSNPLDDSVLRDLSLPVQIASSFDNREVYRRRSESQSYFYAENVSNPICVSGIGIRLSPFCRTQWYLNDGWDKGSRNFTSIQSFFGISKKTIYEFTPEAFTGNVFINWNKFVLPDGDPLLMKHYPHWSLLQSMSGVTNSGTFNNYKEQENENENVNPDGDAQLDSVSSNLDSSLLELEKEKIKYGLDVPFKFAEIHRFMLEMEKTREKLHSWIDLYFGIKQQSFEDFNVFSPLSYMQAKPSDTQGPWMLQCGRVPLKVFETAHETWQVSSRKRGTSIDEMQINRKTSSNEVNQDELSSSQSQSQSPSEEEEEIIKCTFRFDLRNVRFFLRRASTQSEQSVLSNHLKRIKLAKGYQLIINSQGVTLLKNKSSFLSTAISTATTALANLASSSSSAAASNSNSNPEKIRVFDSSLINTNWIEEVSISHDLQYIALSCINNTVVAARIIYEGDSVPTKLRPISHLNINTNLEFDCARHSTINPNQLVCATAYLNNVVLWSISNGRVLWQASFSQKKIKNNLNENDDEKLNQKPSKVQIINFDNNIKKKSKNGDIDDVGILSIGAIEFDPVSDALFVAAGSTLYQMSVSGVVVREIELNEKITAISCFGFGYSFAERAVAVGQVDGTVKIISVNLERKNQKDQIQNRRQSGDGSEGLDGCVRFGEFEVVKEMRISNRPIDRIETNDFSYDIMIYDMTCRLPEFL